MNHAKIRIQSEIIRNTMRNIAANTVELRRAYNKLYDELSFADPQYDRPFERFMLTFTRALNDLQSDRVTDLAAAADEMRDFAGGRQSDDMMRAVLRDSTAVPDARPVVAARCAASVSAQR